MKWLTLVAAAVALLLLGCEQSIVAFGLNAWEVWSTLALTAAIFVMLWLMLRFNCPMWTYLVLLVLMLMPQLRPEWSTYWHGFMHSSIVYEIIERGTPPQNPLMAGEPLRYMYAHHVLIAWLMRFVPISPPQAFFLTDLVTLPLLAFVIDRLAKMVSTDRVFRVFVGVIALCSCSPFMLGPLGQIVEANTLGRIGTYLEMRLVPVLKFLGANSNQFGLVGYGLLLLGLARLADGKGGRVSAHAAVAAAILLSGLVYPPCWPNIVACAGCCALYFVLFAKSAQLRQDGKVLLVLIAVSCAAVLPSLLEVTAGKADGSALHILPSFYHFVRNCIELFLLLIVPAALFLVFRIQLLEAWRRQPDVWVVLLIATLVPMGFYLVLYVPGDAEYKFMHLNVFAMSIPAALAMRELYARHSWCALGLLFLIMLPVASTLVHQPPVDTVADLVRSDGRDLRHTDPDEDALYSWIRKNTPRTAIFVDTRLTIPPLARRPLLVGLDTRRDTGRLKGIEHDGWMVWAEYFLVDNTGVDRIRLARAEALARKLLARQPENLGDDVPRDLRSYAQDHPVYVVTRDPVVRQRLGRAAGFSREFDGRNAAVFRLREAPAGTAR